MSFVEQGEYHFCPNPDCKSFGLLWDDEGFIYHDSKNIVDEFIDDNPYAFGSYARREKAKEDYPDSTRTVFLLYPFKWQVKTSYDINLDGEVAKTNKTLKTLIKKKGYYHLWESPYHLFRRCVNDFKVNKKRYLDGDKNVYWNLRDSLYPPPWDKRWGRKIASCWLRMWNKSLKDDMKL
jgi:hypothetical protein